MIKNDYIRVGVKIDFRTIYRDQIHMKINHINFFLIENGGQFIIPYHFSINYIENPT